jgi:hypothetical protein
VVDCDEFTTISESQLIDLISSDDLEISNGQEEAVFNAVVKASLPLTRLKIVSRDFPNLNVIRSPQSA